MWLLLGISLLWPGHRASAQSGPRLMLNLPPIQGSSVLSGYEHWIEVNNFSWAASKPASSIPGGGVSTNPPTFDDITLTKPQDLSSSNLLYYCAHGLVVTQATLVGAVVGQQYVGRSSVYFKLELRNAYISFVQVEADTSGDPMIEQVGLNFAGKFVWTYSQFSTNGPSLKFDNNYSFAYDKPQKVSGTLVPFKLSGQAGTGVTSIAWQSSPLAIYDISRATDPRGPFSLYTTVTNVSGTNSMTLNITNATGTGFFYSVQGRF
ncbi:MAG: type VI secretion system tube protein Hcp [Limisphaerales bacterium]